MSRNTGLLSALLAIVSALPIAAYPAALPTATSLTLSSSSVPWHTSVTLTAQVTPVTEGTVTFCDLSGIYKTCKASAVVGNAQITAAGAQINIVPAIGTHQYTAAFNATGAALASTSAAQTLTVTGQYPTTTSITASGNPTGYDLTASVASVAPPSSTLSGTVSFQDTSNNNFVLGTALLAQPPSLAQSLVPAAGSPFQTGKSPEVAAVGDFNEDGIPDLAVVNSGDNTVSILQGKGDGTFTLLATTAPFGTPPCESDQIQANCAIAVGDLNDDGHVDLALTSGADNTVTVFEGNGKGVFTPFPGSPITVGTFPEAIKIGDFNNDGNLDLAVANAQDSTMTILLGNGNGAFAPSPASPVSAGIGSFPFFLAVADFNNDGNQDLAVVNGQSNSVSILLGDGTGGFQPFGAQILFPNNSGTSPIVAADFDNDGNIDLAVANFSSSTVYILFGNGTGAFTPSTQSPISLAANANPFGMVALDYNGDGYLDLALANYGYQQPTGSLQILLNQGKPSLAFSPQPPVAMGTEPSDVVTADFNGDGLPDLAVPQSGPATTTTAVLLNQFTQTSTAGISNLTFSGTGTHLVDAVYEGSTYFAPSTSSTIPLQGSQVNTSLTLTANHLEQMITMPVTFTAQLTSLSNEPPFAAPTGMVNFFDQSLGGQLLGTAAMGANGQAVLTTATIGPGVHVISASYAGDATFLPSNSNQITEQIDELRLTQVGSNNPTILPGTTVVYTLQAQPQVATTFLYIVSFSAINLPAGASATFSPPTLAPGSTTAKITMSVTTPATARNTPPPSPFERLPLALGLLLPLFGSKSVRRRMRNIPPLLAVGLLAALSLAAVTGLTGCAGAGIFAQRKVPYTITVTATEGTLQRSTTVPLAIQ